MTDNPKAQALQHIRAVAHSALVDRMRRKRAELDAANQPPVPEPEVETEDADLAALAAAGG